MVAKVETSDQNDSVKKMTVTKLKVLGLKISSVRKSEDRKNEQVAKKGEMTRADKAAAAGEINERLETLETKLEKAQETFGTVIRTIDGFSDFTGDFKGEDDKKKMAATLNTKMKSGQISKEKVDNLVKAKAEHVGILREVEVLLSEPSSLTVIQRGRLSNLQGTAQSALDLLKQAAP
jgi:hypothetical protein